MEKGKILKKSPIFSAVTQASSDMREKPSIIKVAAL
jgi:hypothetical protein